ncbi:MAG: DUF3737 family protein [Peptococcaceae bacterium]|nr:DUF3737 family protein [Peptococcaceae bacterium]
MTIIQDQTFDKERELYGIHDTFIKHCTFDGPADGESALKECSDVRVEDSFFDLRYSLWHDHGLVLKDCTLTENCRAALWYDEDVTVTDTKLHGIKAFRECRNVSLKNCDIISDEFGWFTDDITLENCTAESKYFLMRNHGVRAKNLEMSAKYSLQYIEDGIFEDCVIDSKDAFWHAKNVTVKNSILGGEYLAWYSENLTFENCRIIGTQPFCYCKNLTLINCEMVDCDLAFERSSVQATITTPVVSIKNPLAESRISLPDVGSIIRDIPEATGEIVVENASESLSA